VKGEVQFVDKFSFKNSEKDTLFQRSIVSEKQNQHYKAGNQEKGFILSLLFRSFFSILGNAK
jgi:hypothetical protein